MNIRFLGPLSFILILLFSSSSFAQNNILALISENLNEETQYWWSSDTPEFGGFSKALKVSFEQNRFKFFIPQSPISKVFQKPNLTTGDARSLASILGAKIILNGMITWKEDPPTYGYSIVSAQLKVKFLTHNDSHSQFQVFKGVAFAGSLEEARARVRVQLAQELTQYLIYFKKLKFEYRGGTEWGLHKDELLVQSIDFALFRELDKAFRESHAKMLPVWMKQNQIAYKIIGIDPAAIQRIAKRTQTEGSTFELKKKNEGVVIRTKL